MLRNYRFPIKGNYYYDAQAAYDADLLKMGNRLEIVTEPDNVHDANALQIWLMNAHASDTQNYLPGYVPRQLARIWHPVFSHHPHYTLQLNHVVLQGKWLKLGCKIQLDLTFTQMLLCWLWIAWINVRAASPFRLRPDSHRQ